MELKSVACVGCLLSVLTGCSSTRHAAPDWQPNAVPSEVSVKPLPDGPATWRRICADYPDRAFSDKFRDGFLDGFGKIRNRQGQLTAKIPLRSRHVAGHDPNCDYCNGFRYGSDTATSGWRLPPPSTVPVSARMSDMPLPSGEKLDTSRAVPRLPKPEIPVIPAYDPPLSGWKFPPGADELSPKRAASHLAPLGELDAAITIPATRLPTMPTFEMHMPVIAQTTATVPSLFDDIPAMPFLYPSPQK